MCMQAAPELHLQLRAWGAVRYNLSLSFWELPTFLPCVHVTDMDCTPYAPRCGGWYNPTCQHIFCINQCRTTFGADGLSVCFDRKAVLSFADHTDCCYACLQVAWSCMRGRLQRWPLGRVRPLSQSWQHTSMHCQAHSPTHQCSPAPATAAVAAAVEWVLGPRIGHTQLACMW